MKSKLSLIGVLALIITILSACGGQAKSNSTSEGASAGDVQQVDPNSKIASMSIHMTNNLLALGIKPAGSAIGGGVGDFLPHVKDMLQGTVKLGVVTEPDMEAVLALKPDYIFIEEQFGGQDRAKLEKIAPVVSMDLDQGTWRDQLKQVAAVVGKSKVADEFVKAYDEKTTRVRKLISDELGSNAKVMAIRVSAKELRVMSTSRPVGPIMFEDLQLTPAIGVDKIAEDEPYEVISKEVLPDFDADAIFLIVNDDDNAKKAYNELEKNPLWENLKAVKNNHVYTLDGQKWLDYSSLGQSMAMDDMEQLLAKQ
ncbi:ABC transporter substrate-binding protein [Paenibacillus glycanilyticus]|uniref:Iron-hydroxamate ABC transporter substrate-binding protein n=1 Tax=Paenibacillus glycanilyticus TaxID=126569 RepID=A0ABQ6GBC8_9BACL|nr:ABC transporter substrate-binding protein [Paenibacillus glycanilyticus]GLX66906.1 iron-hydroxamate ABC transporter substrate-binding protein [Paenibacillus glycanilyticus]